VIGTAHEKGTGKDGKPFDRVFRFTDTLLQPGGPMAMRCQPRDEGQGLAKLGEVFAFISIQAT
jgi:hypothetical protein